MRVLSVDSLVLRAQMRADLVDSDHPGEDQWRYLVSQAYAQLHQVVNDSGVPMFVASETIAADGSDFYGLPDGYLSTVSVERVDGSRRVPLRLLMEQERNIIAGTGAATHYRVSGSFTENGVIDASAFGGIYLHPNPLSGSYIHRHTLQPPDLSGAASPSPEVDLLCGAGEDYVVWCAAADALLLQETDERPARQMAAMAEDRLIKWLARGRNLLENNRPIFEPDPDAWNMD